MHIQPSIPRSIFVFLAIFFTALLITSCSSNSNNVNVEFEDGISIPIIDLLGNDLLNVLENELDFPIHRGDDPPNVEAMLLSSSSSPTEATVILQPTILESTNVPRDGIQPGSRFRDTVFRFSNQDMENLTIGFDRIVLGSGPFLGEQSLIIGEDDSFTVFGKQIDVVEQDSVISVNFFSGTIEDGGISSAKGGIIVLDDRGFSIFLPSGTGRVFIDGDGFAELSKWPSTGESSMNSADENSVRLNRLSD